MIELVLSLIFCFQVVMVRIKQTARAMDDEVGSFEFGSSLFTQADLDGFVKSEWLERGRARAPEGGIIPKPHADEVVVFREFSLSGLRFPMTPFVFSVLQRLNIRFHQLIPSCFTKLSTFIWACKTGSLGRS